MTGATGKLNAYLDVYEYGGGDDGRVIALWVMVHFCGPAVGKLARRFAGAPSRELLILESADLFNDAEVGVKLNALECGHRVTLPMRVLSNCSELRRGSGWIDLCGEVVDVALCLDEFGQLAVEAPLVAGWAEFGSSVMASRVSAAESVPHEDWRLLNLLCGTSRSLRDHLEARLNHARVEMLPSVVTGSSIRKWRPVRQNHLKDRGAIIEALRQPNAVFTRKQIGIILASEAKWTMDDAGNFERVEAKRETVASLIAGAGIKPKHSNRFSALDINQRLIPFAATRRSWGLRYEELRDELRDLGIFVTDVPLTNLSDAERPD